MVFSPRKASSATRALTRGNGFVLVFASDLLLPQGECTAVRPPIAVSEKTEPPLFTRSPAMDTRFKCGSQTTDGRALELPGWRMAPTASHVFDSRCAVFNSQAHSSSSRAPAGAFLTAVTLAGTACLRATAESRSTGRLIQSHDRPSPDYSRDYRPNTGLPGSMARAPALNSGLPPLSRPSGNQFERHLLSHSPRPRCLIWRGGQMDRVSALAAPQALCSRGQKRTVTASAPLAHRTVTETREREERGTASCCLEQEPAPIVQTLSARSRSSVSRDRPASVGHHDLDQNCSVGHKVAADDLNSLIAIHC
jgi:hypothetical protein